MCVFSQVGILQYGEIAVHEWSLKDYQTTEDVVEAAKNINRQEGRETRTAYAIQMAWYDCQSFFFIVLSISLSLLLYFLSCFFFIFWCVRVIFLSEPVVCVCVHVESEHSIVPLSLSQCLLRTHSRSCNTIATPETCTNMHGLQSSFSILVILSYYLLFFLYQYVSFFHILNRPTRRNLFITHATNVTSALSAESMTKFIKVLSEIIS